MTDRLITTTATVYRAPVEGATWRIARPDALHDWALSIIRDAPCRGGSCTTIRGGMSLACSRHYSAWAGRGLLSVRLARILGYWEGRG